MIKLLNRDVLRDTLTGFVTFTRTGLTVVGFTALCVVAIATAKPEFADTLKHTLMSQADASQSDDSASAAAPVMDAAGLLGFASSDSAAAGGTSGAGNADGDDDRDIPVHRDGKTLAHDAQVLGTVREQAAISRYLARKYHVSVDAVDLMVSASYLTGRDVGLDPSLLLAVIAIESGFNPFAESGVGAQGLMQVMAKVHSDKLDDFGGARAALNPVANIKVGALILKDCIRRGGSVKDGLRLYVGAATGDDAGYGLKVLQEKDRILMAARGGNPFSAAPSAPVMAPAVAPAYTTTVAPAPAKPAVVVASSAAPAPSALIKAPEAAGREPLRLQEQDVVKTKDKMASL